MSGNYCFCHFLQSALATFLANLLFLIYHNSSIHHHALQLFEYVVNLCTRRGRKNSRIVPNDNHSSTSVNSNNREEEVVQIDPPIPPPPSPGNQQRIDIISLQVISPERSEDSGDSGGDTRTPPLSSLPCQRSDMEPSLLPVLDTIADKVSTKENSNIGDDCGDYTQAMPSFPGTPERDGAELVSLNDPYVTGANETKTKDGGDDGKEPPVIMPSQQQSEQRDSPQVPCFSSADVKSTEEKHSTGGGEETQTVTLSPRSEQGYAEVSLHIPNLSSVDVTSTEEKHSNGRNTQINTTDIEIEVGEEEMQDFHKGLSSDIHTTAKVEKDDNEKAELKNPLFDPNSSISKDTKICITEDWEDIKSDVKSKLGPLPPLRPKSAHGRIPLRPKTARGRIRSRVLPPPMTVRPYGTEPWPKAGTSSLRSQDSVTVTAKKPAALEEVDDLKDTGMKEGKGEGGSEQLFPLFTPSRERDLVRTFEEGDIDVLIISSEDDIVMASSSSSDLHGGDSTTVSSKLDLSSSSDEDGDLPTTTS